MANSRIGIKRCLISPPGRMATPLPWPDGNLVSIGVRKASHLVISPLDELTDYRNRKLRNKINFKYSVDSYQLSMRDLQLLMLFMQNGYDFQLVKEAQTPGLPASGGVFNWANQVNGLGFVYTMTNKDRFCTVNFETALEFENAKALIAAADTYNSVLPIIASDPVSGGNERGENFSLVKHPWYFSIEAPTGSTIFDKKEIIERSLKISSKGTKNEYNEDVVNFINVELKIKGSDATINKIYDLLNRSMSPSLSIKEMTSPNTWEELVFQPNVLTHSDDFQLGDDQDFSQVTFAADLTFDQITFDYGAMFGGIGVNHYAPEFNEVEARVGATVTLGDPV